MVQGRRTAPGPTRGGAAGRPDFEPFGRDLCGDLDGAERREWWLANSRGG